MKSKRGVFGGTAALWLARKRYTQQLNVCSVGSLRTLQSARTATFDSNIECDAKIAREKLCLNAKIVGSASGDVVSGISNQCRPNRSLDVCQTTHTKRKKREATFNLSTGSTNFKERAVKKSKRGVFGIVHRKIFQTKAIETRLLSDMATGKRQTEQSKTSPIPCTLECFNSSDSSQVTTQDSVCSSLEDPFQTVEKTDDPTQCTNPLAPADCSSIGQPGHHSSLKMARAFFAQIDADDSLLRLEEVNRNEMASIVERSTSCVGSSSQTTRAKMPEKIAKLEYQKYCTACRESDVLPLSMRVFLVQRSACFRTGEIFDGMFEE